MDDPTLTIGQVAAGAGINTSAIRYYERVGVLPRPERRSGQRRYTDRSRRGNEALTVASGCDCETLDVCGLFASGNESSLCFAASA